MIEGKRFLSSFLTKTQKQKEQKKKAFFSLEAQPTTTTTLKSSILGLFCML
jgi:hypothetical protein